MHRTFLLCLVSTILPAATTLTAEPQVRFVTTGWNAPTVQQFLRDAEVFLRQPFDGCAMNARADTAPPNPLSKAHTAGSWDQVSFASTESALGTLDPKTTRHSYLTIKANPGDADWLDDEAWVDVVQHWRIAARLAKRGKLRGLLFDPEPYTRPFEQFNYDTQANSKTHSFDEYAKAARKRGRQVMQAIADEYPQAEFFSYFLMSYLVDHHQYRGPSPIDEDGRREDFQWCLSAHSYGLLPAFVSGLLEASPKNMTFVDGCEYGYWLRKESEFAKLARDVRSRGRWIVESDVRERYDRQISVAFPIFVDIIHPELIAQWAIEPDNSDRARVLRRQLTAAASAGDGLVWFYSERGRWWPPARDTTLWKGKDTYLHWNDLLDGCLETIADVRGNARPNSLKFAAEETETPSVGKVVPIQKWDSWTRKETSGEVEVKNDSVTISAATDSAGMTGISVNPGERYRVTSKVRQLGRGVPRLVVRYRDSGNQWIVRRGIESFAYPESGDPSQWRTLQADAVVPEGAEKLMIVLSVKKQRSPDDIIEFTETDIRTLHVGRR